MPAACAIELIHTYSLIHDDLPAMDDDSLRRGRPTNHVVHGEGMAILAGDGLLDRGICASCVRAARSRLGAEKDSRRFGRLPLPPEPAAWLAARRSIFSPSDRQRPSHGSRCRTCTRERPARLIRAAAVAGAIMAGGTDELIRAVEDYGWHLGLAFQIVDDILDVEGEAKDLGKTDR